MKPPATTTMNGQTFQYVKCPVCGEWGWETIDYVGPCIFCHSGDIKCLKDGPGTSSDFLFDMWRPSWTE